MPRLVRAGISLLFTSFLVLPGCGADDGSEDADADASSEIVQEGLSGTRPGVNGSACKRSAYDCTLHGGASGQRVKRADGGETWAVASGTPNTPIMDGNGDLMGTSRRTSFTLNYGQTRRMGNTTYVYALSTGLGASGWVPIDAFLHADSLRARVGEVDAKGAGLRELGCYEVSTGFDASLNRYKVVKGATDADAMEPDDYLPTKRANGGIYMNLAFNVPGDAIGGPAVDIFPAGTKFQRLDVPTWEGSAPSLDAKLYSKASGAKAYDVLSSRTMKFLYGYVRAKNGAVRYGWMAEAGLDVSSGCPKR